MKKTIVTLVVMLFAAAGAFAQVEKGTILVGASSNAGFTSFKQKDADESTSQFNINAKVGYFVIDNLALGLNLGYTSVKDLGSSTAIGAFGRYYVNGKIIIGAGFNSNKEKDDVSDTDFSYTTIPLEVGYAAFITDNIAIEPALGYTLYSGDLEGSAFGLNVGFTLYLNRGE
jgi:outer membrane protein